MTHNWRRMKKRPEDAYAAVECADCGYQVVKKTSDIEINLIRTCEEFRRYLKKMLRNATGYHPDTVQAVALAMTARQGMEQ